MNLIEQISQDLSLRTPQKAALMRLDNIFQTIPNFQEKSLQEIEALVMAGSFESFDTLFPSFCFDIATGVGKTLLMGACIAYLYKTQKWRNFFILTKGNTIYQKTIANFSEGDPKYTLRGYTDLPHHELITGENYLRQEVGNRLSRKQLPLLDDLINIFIFNVEKLFDNPTEQRRFYDPQEELGGSLADLLAGQNDLVLLMDESHHYRATASMAVIEALRPVVGLEFTATPTARNRNIIYRYDLGQAIRDAHLHLENPSVPSGFIKIPVVLGRRDMRVTEDAFQEIQLKDGIARHRQKKTLLEAYHKNNGLIQLLPIVLISTRNIDHAEEVRQFVESDDFFNGEYKNKTVVTHSRTGELRDDDITGLLNLEKPTNDKEIVIHVNKLREGWDVKNVYTIIPLRASQSEVLTVQTIGRGLRLPFGKQTGDEELDTLEIAAHDHFASIVNAARENATRTSIPIYTKDITPSERMETEVWTVVPRPNSPFYIRVPKLVPSYDSTGRLQDFDIIPKYELTKISSELVSSILGQTTQKTFNVPMDDMSEDPIRYLVRSIFERCSSINPQDSNDKSLVPQLVLKYLIRLDSDSESWKRYVQIHAEVIIRDVIEQIQEHIVVHTKVDWQPTGEILEWKGWARRVTKNYMPPRFDTVSDEECTKRLLTGYQRTIYNEAIFDSAQEKYLADILERDLTIRAWIRVPPSQLEIFYAAGNYNPDFLADDGTIIYILEVKNSDELNDETVQRKAAAARAWCEAASKLGGRTWTYKLLPHNIIQTTDSFAGVISRAYKPPLPFPQVQQIIDIKRKKSIERALKFLNEEDVDVALQLLSKEFEDTIKAYLVAANSKGQLRTTPGGNPDTWKLANMVDSARANGKITDIGILQYLRQVRNDRAHGPTPTREERINIMNSAPYLAGLYIGYIRIFESMLVEL